MEALNEIRMALSGLTGVLPRRAVLLDDHTLADRLTDPTKPEVASLSLACEALRRASNEPVFHRHTSQLLVQCLNTNDPRAWRAMLDDAVTGDLDGAAMAAFWGNGDNTDQLLRCLVEVKCGMHLWLVIRAMQYVLPIIDGTCTLKLGAAFERTFPDLVRTLARSAKDISYDSRATAITVLGKVLVWCNIPVAQQCGMLDIVLNCSTEDLMRLFVFAPMQQLAELDGNLVERIVARAERASQASRYPPLALLATLAPEQLQSHDSRVLKIVQRTLDTAAAQGNIDARMALVCGVLAKSTAPAKSLTASLGHALCCVSLSPSAS